jgi:hypothetical protein
MPDIQHEYHEGIESENMSAYYIVPENVKPK